MRIPVLAAVVDAIQGKPFVRRSAKWPALRKDWLAGHPTCAACGGTEQLEAHHKKPFHLYPALELVPANLITLCEKRKCHLIVGHAYDWRRENPNVTTIAAMLLKAVQQVIR